MYPSDNVSLAILERVPICTPVSMSLLLYWSVSSYVHKSQCLICYSGACHQYSIIMCYQYNANVIISVLRCVLMSACSQLCSQLCSHQCMFSAVFSLAAGARFRRSGSLSTGTTRLGCAPLRSSTRRPSRARRTLSTMRSPFCAGQVLMHCYHCRSGPHALLTLQVRSTCTDTPG